MLQIVMGVTEFKASPRHLNFLKQLKVTIEMDLELWNLIVELKELLF